MSRSVGMIFPALLEFVRADTEGAGDYERVGHDVEGMAEVDDEGAVEAGALGVVDHGHELLGFEAQAAELGGGTAGA